MRALQNDEGGEPRLLAETGSTGQTGLDRLSTRRLIGPRQGGSRAASRFLGGMMDHHRSSEHGDVVDLPVSRRTLAAGAVWSLPVIATIGAAPAMAASSFGPLPAGSATASGAGTWANPSNATGSVNGVYSTWTGGQNQTGILTLGSFSTINKSVTVESISVRLWFYVTKKIDSVQVRLYNSGNVLIKQWTASTVGWTSTGHDQVFTHNGNWNTNLNGITVAVVANHDNSNSTGSVYVDAATITHNH